MIPNIAKQNRSGLMVYGFDSKLVSRVLAGAEALKGTWTCENRVSERRNAIEVGIRFPVTVINGISTFSRKSCRR